MSQAQITNAGTPLTPGASAPLWTDACDNSTNLVNIPQPAAISVPLTDIIGGGNRLLQFAISALDQIESIVISGTMKGKLNDLIGLVLKHETYGSVPLMANHSIQGPFTNPYPQLGDTRTFLFGETVPYGYVFQSMTGVSSSQQIVLPEGQSPTDYYYYFSGAAGYDWQVRNITPGAAPTQIVVPAHRYPYSPVSNWNNVPYNYGSIYGTNGLYTQTAPIIFRGFRYRLLSTGGGQPVQVQTKTFQRIIELTGDYGAPSTIPGVPPDSWGYFNDTSDGLQSNESFSETLYNNYGAHFWQVTNVQHVVNYKSRVSLGAVIISYQIYDTITVTFFKYPDITWSVEPLAQITWESILPPTALYVFYPPDFNDYTNFAERSEPLNITSLDFKGKGADGVWTLEIDSVAAALPQSNNSPVAISPTVALGRVQLAGLIVTFNFKANAQYISNALEPSTNNGVTEVICQGSLRLNGDDRAMLGILCGINGSNTMGIFCGYAIQRIGRVGAVYNTSYLIATVCSMQQVNSTRPRTAISYWQQDWGDRAFSTKGDAGQAFVLGAYDHRIYPIFGQIGMRIRISGTKLTFEMLGQYPPLVFIDPTVAMVDNFTRYTLDAQ